jgi:lipoprotein LprG
MGPRCRLVLVSALVAAVLGAAAGCGGAEESTESIEEALTSAKRQLDETPGVRLDLSTDALPDGIDGLTAASGIATHQPAFDGEVELQVSGLPMEVPVVAVDGLVFAKLPFTARFTDIDASAYGAPDPAQLMDPESGLSSWLTEATDVSRGDQVRDGSAVLTSYSGSLAGEAVVRSIPSAVEAASFEVTFLLDDSDQLRSAEVAGPFYEEDSRVEYRIELSEYGSDTRITRP